MPELSIAAKNAALNAIQIAQLSLHSAYDPNGGNELVGGEPAYARLAVTFAAAAFANLNTGSLEPFTFNVPAGTVAWLGLWDIDNNFLGMLPCGGGRLQPFVVDDTDLSLLRCASHGLLLGDTFVIWASSGAFLPLAPGTPDLTEGAIYSASPVGPNTLQVNSTPDAPDVTPLVFNNAGGGFIQSISPVSSGVQSTFSVTAITIEATVAG